MERRAVIMAGADISDYSFYQPQKDDFVICVDGGYRHAVKLGIKPDILLGDFDSLQCDPPKEIERITFPSEKDESDLHLAVLHTIRLGFRKITAIGVLGGRCDHFLGNIGLMLLAEKHNVSLTLLDAETEMFLLKNASIDIPAQNNTYLSVIALFDDIIYTIRGTKYEVEKVRLCRGETRGISNEFLTEKAHLSVSEGNAVILLCRKD